MSDLLYYILCGVLIAGILTGIALMSKVQLAAVGNLISALCTAGAIVLTMRRYNILTALELWICAAIGLVVGLVWAYRIKMIDMPQAVALLNGLGGAASAIVAGIALTNGAAMRTFGIVTAGAALIVGTLTFTGSLIAAGKLHKVLGQKPVVWKRHQAATTVLLLLSLSGMPLFVFEPAPLLLCIIYCCFTSAWFGITFTVRIGGADMPITISLLNSLSGVAGGIAGMAIGDPLLVAIGGIVGASGLLLTQIMCRAMNRRLSDILSGKTSLTSNPPVPEHQLSKAECTPEPEPRDAVNPADILMSAKKVIIVPGYGMALAQAQHLVKELADALEKNGAQVHFAIHPVAGRMPGHMNVLLAEADVPYEKLLEMDDVNPQFAECDAAIIVGANDVVNPAANTAEGTPIYGMPILNVGQAKHLILCNYDLSPGYAGVENPLYNRQGVVVLLGDAKETVRQLMECVF